ncbi:Xaa-Pro peptidase family protein [Pelagibacteraceae bacterium]|nr:Xaa-Pro peptidase family protein [Pelagibacteraceae bacterium]
MNDFPKKEFISRIEKIQIHIEKENIEAVIITSPSNFRYFTGLDSNFWESPTRPWYLIISKKNPIKAIIPSIGITAMQNTLVNDIEAWESPNPKDEGVSLLKKNIKSFPKNSNIGFELGNETFLRMSIKDFHDIQKNLLEYNFVDASKILWSIRKIKSEIEINNIKEICSITSKVFDNFPQKINLGMSEKEIASTFKKEIIESGADYIPYMACASGLNGYNQIICNPTERVTKDGDILIIDTGSTLNGYFCDFDRNFGFGNISQKSLDAYSKLWIATEKTLEIIKPGISCKEIYESLSNNLFSNNTKSTVGRMGHGFGLQLTEPPSIMNDDNTILEKNMILALEPSIEIENGLMLVHEENVLITENGNKLLTSRTPKELPIVNT